MFKNDRGYLQEIGTKKKKEKKKVRSNRAVKHLRMTDIIL